MKNASTLALTAPPDEGLRALQSAVARRFQWRILTGGAPDQPRFVIEKRVRYDLIRGLPLYAIFRITGRFEKTTSGATALHYAVSAPFGVPFMHAALLIGVLLIFTVVLARLTSSPGIAGNPVGPALVGVMVLLIGAYGVYAWRGYHCHLRELADFMEAFAGRMGTLRDV